MKRTGTVNVVITIGTDGPRALSVYESDGEITHVEANAKAGYLTTVEEEELRTALYHEAAAMAPDYFGPIDVTIRP